MTSFILRRLVWLLPVFLFVSLVTFALMHAVEGGPWDEERPLPASTVENLNRKYGLDEPLWRQYVDFAANALQGDLGISYARQDKPVTAIIVDGFRVTAVLGGLALALSVVAGVSLGVLAAVHRNRLPDYGGVFLASVGSAVPAFVLGILLIYVFAVKLHWLPTFGWDLSRGLVPGWLPPWKQMVLPVLTLAALLTGSFIVEQLFSLPGTGRLFVQSVNARDYGLIMGSTLFYAAVIAAANLAVDVAYATVDPRIRYR